MSLFAVYLQVTSPDSFSKQAIDVFADQPYELYALLANYIHVLFWLMQANHDCIDNIIHTKAGVQVRLDCAEIIRQQGRNEGVLYALLANYIHVLFWLYLHLHCALVVE
jgi:hypothetical protein